MNQNKLVTNYRYRISKMLGQEISIIDEVDNITYKITFEILKNHFKLPYAVTCDSVQGLTKNEKLTILDSNTPYVNRKFLWTAMTRVKKLEDITIFIHSENDIKFLTQSRLKLYLNEKIASYKSQDRKANRGYELEEFITAEWINEEIEKTMYCTFCKKHFELYLDEHNNVKSNITVDRIDNKKAHIITNSQLCCHHCNITKGNRY